MKSLILIFKNDFYRILSKKSVILTMLVFVPLMICGGIYFTSKMEAKANIAVVSQNKKLNMEGKNIKITVVDKVPPMYELVMNKYDGVIVDNGKGNFKVITIKSDKFRNRLEQFLKNPNSPVKSSDDNEKRGVGTNIIGFLIMIVLMQQMYLMTLYPEDRDFGTFKRMLISPLSSGQYLLAQGIFNFVITFLPVYISVMLVKEILGVNIGFSSITLAGLLALLILFGTAFSLFMTSAMDDLDNASMLGNFIIIIASTISGSFYSFTDSSRILDSIVKIIPIKGYLTFVQGIENGKSILNYGAQLSYFTAFVLALFTLGVFITRKNLSTGKY